MWQQILQSMARLDAGEIRENHFDVPGELPENLPARTAGRGGLCRVRDDSDALERSVSLRHGFEYRDAFGAHRQPVSGILEVAAGDDTTVRRLECGADFKIR